MILYLNAKDEKCDDNFVWCDQQEQKRFVGPEFPWRDLDPDDLTGNEVCVSMWISPNGSFVLIDVLCTFRFYYICEVKNYSMDKMDKL